MKFRGKFSVKQYKREKFKNYFEEYYPSLCRFASRITWSNTDAEDLVQGVFLKLWELDLRFSSDQQACAYLFTSVKNACLNHLRNKQAHGMHIQADSVGGTIQDGDKSIQHILIEEELYRRLFLSVNKLSPERKRIILLSLEGLSNQEIAEKTNVSVNTIKTLKSKAYKCLRADLKFILFFF